MGRRVIIQQAAKATKSLQDIITRLKHPLDDLRAYLSHDEYALLEAFSPDGHVFVRGVEDSPDGVNRRRWATIEPGDLALIAWKGSFRFAGQVRLRKESSEFALAAGAPTHDLLYFLHQLDPVLVPYALVNSALGYEISNPFQRFAVLDEEQSVQVLEVLN